MIAPQILDMLKRKDLVNLATAMNASGCARMSKAELIELVRTRSASSGGESPSPDLTTPGSNATVVPEAAVGDDVAKKPRGRRGRKSATNEPAKSEASDSPITTAEQDKPTVIEPEKKPRARRGRKSAATEPTTVDVPVAVPTAVVETAVAEQEKPAENATEPKPRGRRGRKSATAEPATPEAPAVPSVAVESEKPVEVASEPKPRGRRGRKSATAEPATPEAPAVPSVAVEPEKPVEIAPEPKPRGRRGRKSATAEPATPEAPAVPSVAVEPEKPVEIAPEPKPRGRRGRKSATSEATTPDVSADVVEQEKPAASEPVKKRRGRKSAHDSSTPLFDVITPATDLPPAESQESTPSAKPKRGRPRREPEGVQPEAPTVENVAPTPEVAEAPSKKRGRKPRVKEADSVAKESDSSAPPQTRQNDEPTVSTPTATSVAEPATPEPVEPTKKARRPYTRRKKMEEKPEVASTPDVAADVTTEPADGATSIPTAIDAPVATSNESSNEHEPPKRRRGRRAKNADADSTSGEQSADPKQRRGRRTTLEEGQGETEPRAARPASGSSLDVKTDDLAKPEIEETSEKTRRQPVMPQREKTDRIVLIVCDPHWLRACWETSDALLERVRAAMGRHWHTADPILRVYRVERETNGSTIRREMVADVVVQLELNNWYVQVDDPPQHFMVELGYRARDGQFFTLVSSNIVTTPQRYIHDAFSRPVFNPVSPGFDPNPYRNGDRIGRSRVEGDLPTPLRRRSLGANLEIVQPTSDQNGRVGARLSEEFTPYEDKLQLDVDAEVVIRGKVSEGASVKVKEEPILVNSEGAFSVRFSLPERRHVYPVVATSGDGVETHTIIIAIDRNTKTLDPVFREDED